MVFKCHAVGNQRGRCLTRTSEACIWKHSATIFTALCLRQAARTRAYLTFVSNQYTERNQNMRAE